MLLSRLTLSLSLTIDERLNDDSLLMLSLQIGEMLVLELLLHVGLHTKWYVMADEWWFGRLLPISQWARRILLHLLES